MNITLIPLNLIDPNPYQMREKEDFEHVAKIATSIASMGLMQVPVGRYVGERVQLAFGHTRLAAYYLLHEQTLYEQIDASPNPWSMMPVGIQELTDQNMFEMGISENMSRKDLTPIEEARAMKIYRDQFGKKSAEIGRLFGLSESAVRNKIRLVELPEEAQTALSSGQISEGTARQLLSLEKLQPGATARVIGEITEFSLTPETISRKIENAIDRKETNVMWSSWEKGAPCGGKGLWPLTWAPGKMIPITWVEFQKFIPDEWKKSNNFSMAALKVFFESTTYWIIDGGYDLAKLIAAGSNPEVANLVWTLMHPPACTACEHHAAINGAHYCGWKACWKRKKEAWMESELSRLVMKLDIRRYSEDRDGKYFEYAGESHYDDEKREYVSNEETFRAWMAEQNPDLRLRVIYHEYGSWKITDSYVVQLLSVNPEVVRRLKAQEAKLAQQEKERQVERQNFDFQDKQRRNGQAYIRKTAAWIFAAPFKGLPLPILAALALKTLNGQKAEELARDAAVRLIEPDWGVLRRGPLAVAHHLKGVAISWGLPEPRDGWDEWINQAQKYETVSTETIQEAA